MSTEIPPALPILLVVVGPAGSGKSTLCDRFPRERPDFSRVVTTTTRPMRPGEINGVHYHFFEPQEFKAKIERGEFLEWALIHGEHHDRLYGTLRSSVLEPLFGGRNLIMNIDVQGVESLRKLSATELLLKRCMVTVFIKVDRDRLLERLRKRGQDPEDEISRRMVTFDREMAEADKFDFRIESGTREEDFARLQEISDLAREIVLKRAA